MINLNIGFIIALIEDPEFRNSIKESLNIDISKTVTDQTIYLIDKSWKDSIVSLIEREVRTEEEDFV